jgi:RNA polymerase sigma-70 factor (ECF subfamily)
MKRGDARQRRVATQAAAGLPDGYEPTWPSVDRSRLEGCVRTLEPREQSVIIATFAEDRDASEIAASLAITPGNVRVIRHRALARLQTCLEGAPS